MSVFLKNISYRKNIIIAENYAYFLPCFTTDDHTRVKLAQLAEKDGKLTDYINANYVDVSAFFYLSAFSVQTDVWRWIDLTKKKCHNITGLDKKNPNFNDPSYFYKVKPQVKLQFFLESVLIL